jgi:hypothetical protein
METVNNIEGSPIRWQLGPLPRHAHPFMRADYLDDRDQHAHGSIRPETVDGVSLRRHGSFCPSAGDSGVF